MYDTLFGQTAQGFGPAIFQGKPPSFPAVLAPNPYRRIPTKELARRLDFYASLPLAAREKARSIWQDLDAVFLLRQV